MVSENKPENFDNALKKSMEYIDRNSFKFIDIKYSTLYNPDKDPYMAITYSAIIIYEQR